MEFIPGEREDGVLYVSIPYATAVHSCACGCGEKVVTPLTPTDWQLIFDGETVSLTPSIGNWSFQCQSHYWIKRNHVVWAQRWSKKQIEEGRRTDRLAKRRHFDDVVSDQPKDKTRPEPQRRGLWHKLVSLLRRDRKR